MKYESFHVNIPQIVPNAKYMQRNINQYQTPFLKSCSIKFIFSKNVYMPMCDCQSVYFICRLLPVSMYLNVCLFIRSFVCEA